MNEIERQVLRQIGEDPSAPDVFTDDAVGMEPIRDSLNEAIAELNLLTGGNTETLTVPLLQNKTFYRLSMRTGEMAWIRTMWLSNARRKLTQTSLLALQDDDPRWMRARGNPRSYVPVGFSTFALYPISSSSTDMVELEIVTIPARYEDSNDWLKVRRGWEYALVNYAVSEYWASRGDARTADQHMRHYANALGNRLRYPDTAENLPRAQSLKQGPDTQVGPVLNN